MRMQSINSVMNYKKPAFWIIVMSVIACALVAVCLLTNPDSQYPFTQSADTAPRYPFTSDYGTDGVMLTNESITNRVAFVAEILEIHDGYFLVEPIEGSLERNSADQIKVSMTSMDPDLEPQVGDIIEISYSGAILECYPAELNDVYNIRVVQEVD